MERDSFLAHGASALLKERLCLLSDGREAIFCNNCGTKAMNRTGPGINEQVCFNCNREESDDPGRFGKNTIPHTFNLLADLLAGMNIKMSFVFKDRADRLGMQDELSVEEQEEFFEVNDNLDNENDDISDDELDDEDQMEDWEEGGYEEGAYEEGEYSEFS